MQPNFFKFIIMILAVSTISMQSEKCSSPTQTNPCKAFLNDTLPQSSWIALSPQLKINKCKICAKKAVTEYINERNDTIVFDEYSGRLILDQSVDKAKVAFLDYPEDPALRGKASEDSIFLTLTALSYPSMCVSTLLHEYYAHVKSSNKEDHATILEEGGGGEEELEEGFYRDAKGKYMWEDGEKFYLSLETNSYLRPSSGILKEEVRGHSLEVDLFEINVISLRKKDELSFKNTKKTYFDALTK